MRFAPASAAVILTFGCICGYADTAPQKLVVTGTLNRVMAIGAESTGWVVQLDSETPIEGKPVSSIQIRDSRQPGRLEHLENKHVRVVWQTEPPAGSGNRNATFYRGFFHQGSSALQRQSPRPKQRIDGLGAGTGRREPISDWQRMAASMLSSFRIWMDRRHSKDLRTAIVFDSHATAKLNSYPQAMGKRLG